MTPRSKDSTTRRRASWPCRVRASGDRRNASRQAAASSWGRRDGTTQPVSPTIAAESPTSVTTQGTPHAIASPTTRGKASLTDDDTSEVEPRHQPRDVAARAQQVAAPPQAERVDRRGERGVPPINAFAAEQELDLRRLDGQNRRRAQEGLVVLERIEPRDQADQRRILGQAKLGSHAAPSVGVGPEGRGIEPVRDDLQSLRLEPPPLVLNPRCLGTADDPGRQPPREPGTRRDGPQRGAFGQPRGRDAWCTPQTNGTRSAIRTASPPIRFEWSIQVCTTAGRSCRKTRVSRATPRGSGTPGLIPSTCTAIPASRIGPASLRSSINETTTGRNRSRSVRASRLQSIVSAPPKAKLLII